jgi:hypothetical protein
MTTNVPRADADEEGALLLHEYYGHEGELVRVHVGIGGDGHPWVREGEERFALPEGAIASVFSRYGMPLDAAAPASLEELRLDEQLTLGRFRFRPRVDVIARDYALLTQTGQEPSCVLATHLAAVLLHLGRRAAQLADARVL